MDIYNPQEVNYIRSLQGDILKTALVEIGAWDMDANSHKQVAYPTGVTLSNVRSMQVFIQTDVPNTMSPITTVLSAGVVAGGYYFYTAHITLWRTDGAVFDDNDYDDTSINRGYCHIWYEQ